MGQRVSMTYCRKLVRFNSSSISQKITSSTSFCAVFSILSITSSKTGLLTKRLSKNWWKRMEKKVPFISSKLSFFSSSRNTLSKRSMLVHSARCSTTERFTLMIGSVPGTKEAQSLTKAQSSMTERQRKLSRQKSQLSSNGSNMEKKKMAGRMTMRRQSKSRNPKRQRPKRINVLWLSRKRKSKKRRC